MDTGEHLSAISEILDNNIPSMVTLEALESGTMDLSEELDEFDGQVKDCVGLDELEPDTVKAAQEAIKAVIALATTSEDVTRKDLLIFLLEVLVEKIDEIIMFG